MQIERNKMRDITGEYDQTETRYFELIRDFLRNRDDLRNKKYRGNPNRIKGHCYVASEALYHLLGGKEEGYKPMCMRYKDGTHWFLKNRHGWIIDPTYDQDDYDINYENATGKGFLKKPSKRARIVIKYVNKEMKKRLVGSIKRKRHSYPKDLINIEKVNELITLAPNHLKVELIKAVKILRLAEIYKKDLKKTEKLEHNMSICLLEGKENEVEVVK